MGDDEIDRQYGPRKLNTKSSQEAVVALGGNRGLWSFGERAGDVISERPSKQRLQIEWGARGSRKGSE